MPCVCRYTGAELLVRGASSIATRFGIAPIVIGLTVVAFGTSAPEFAVSVQGALTGNSDVAIGNVVGSSTFNILLVHGGHRGHLRIDSEPIAQSR